MKFIFLIIISSVLLCCKSETELPIDDTIVLVNAGNANRQDLSIALDRLAKCQPKIVGINLVFKDQNTPYDTMLAKSIKTIGNIVLVSLLKDRKIVSSDSIFSRAALAEGVINYGLEDDGSIGKQMMYVSVDDDLIWSLPTTLASYFDIDKADHVMKNAKGNQFYEIDYQNDFRVVEIDQQFDCSMFSNRIVLIGYLGPDNEDLLLTKLGEKRYSTWILANCVRNIQEGQSK